MDLGRLRIGLRRLFGGAPDEPRRPDPAEAAIEAAMGEIRASGLFDPDWYLARNPDVAAAGIDPLRHYVEAGAREGRRASPHLDPLWYLGENPEASGPGGDPLLHYIRTGRALGRTPKPLDEAQGFDSFLAAYRASALPFAGQVRAEIDHVHFALKHTAAPPGGPPLPPLALSERIGSPTLEGFEAIGRGVKQTIIRCLPPGFDLRGARVLDFGCGIGRVIRHFTAEAAEAEFWGADIDGTSIRWAVENLTPPFRFYQMSEAPSLPFEDNSVDLIYSIAVFSQVYDGWHHWAAELRRVLKPGGIFFMSYAGQVPFEEMLGLPYAEFAADPGLYVKNPFNSWNRGGPMVFLSPAWVERYWGSLFDIEFVAPDALLDYQSICVMRKPEAGRPPRMGAPTLDTATRQAFDADAVGRIDGRFDTRKPFRDSYGVELAEDGEISGWIALRGDAPERLDVAVDGRDVSSETLFEPGAPYRDWADTLQTVFRTRLDAASLPRGRTRLSVRVTGRRGTTHEMSIPLLAASAPLTFRPRPSFS